MALTNDIFNPVGAQEESFTGTSDVYKVSYKKGKDGKYVSVIRFLPFVKDPSKSIMEKRVTYLKDVVTGRGMYVDDPRTIGQPSPVTDMFFNLYNTQRKDYQDFAKANLSTKTQYASLIQVISDEQNPSLNGKVMIFIYGKSIWDKLHQEQYPVQTGTGCNPFHPINGRQFCIVCTAKSSFNNFDQSYFMNNIDPNTRQFYNTGIIIDNPNTGTKEIATSATDQSLIVNFLEKNSPNLYEYAYKPWSDEQIQFVNSTLANIESALRQGRLPYAVNNMANIPTTMSPQFPGINQVPQMPQVTVQQSQMPQYQQMPQNQIPQQNSAMMPQVTQPQQNSINQGIEGLSIGMTTAPQAQSPIFGSNNQGIVSGVEMPNISSMPQNNPAGMNPNPGIGGNIDLSSVLGDL